MRKLIYVATDNTVYNTWVDALASGKTFRSQVAEIEEPLPYELTEKQKARRVSLR